jgi:dolichol kinase
MILIVGPWTGGWGMGHFGNRRWGRRKLRTIEDRSWEGFVLMFLFGVASCYLLLGLYEILFYWQFASAIALLSPMLFVSILVVSLVAAVLEAISPSIYDNAIIPIGIIISLLLLGSVGIFPYPLFNL